MTLEITDNTRQGRTTRPGPATTSDRRDTPGSDAEQAGAKPWQFDTRVAAPRPPVGPATAVPVPAPATDPGPDTDAVARSYLGLRDRGAGDLDRTSMDRWEQSVSGDRGVAGLFRDLHLGDPSEAARFARGLTSLPEPGQEFLGFHLVEELGRGAFGRVYLAQQGDLADRYVALKVSTELPGESRTLAQLQHTNIVPIFSAHQAGPLHAVCMPYFGMTTLKDVCDDLGRSGETPASGRSLLKNLSSRRSLARPAGSSAPGARPPSSIPTVEAAAVSSDAPDPAGPEDADQPAPEPATAPLSNTLRMIGEMPYNEAVLWIGSRLADGLAHAHERGILHRDLKPANILLTDDGQPMILDFNLSHDTRATAAASAASVGGTLPYMAPEHLAAFRGESRDVDARSDLYALGIILYELLTRRHPFPEHDDSRPETLDRMIAERQGPPPRIRTWNERVSPAAESIIRRCLEPQPARRYQSVRDLHEDLERHLADLPLKHAPEPSLRERAGKFFRRNPRFGNLFGLTVALIAVLATGVMVAAWGQRLARLEATETLNAFRDEFGTARYVLSVRSRDRAERDRGARLGRQALGRYRVIEDPAWFRSAAVANLPDGDRARLRDEVGEALSILAEAAALDASALAEPARAERAHAGLDLTGLALACFGDDRAPRTTLAQRAELLGLLGQDGDARAARDRADRVPNRAPRDFLMASTDLLLRGDLDRAMPLAEEATRRDPASFWAWFTLGVIHDRGERPAQALACFQTCVALRPDFHHAWFNRGLGHMRDGQPGPARADFDRAIELKPDWHEPYLNRALARRDLGDHPGAVEDLTRALERGATQTRIYFLRSTARARAGDPGGARKDREIGLSRAPADEASWVARALERMATDPAAALADFEKASELNPSSLQALHMRAHLLAVALGRLDEAAPLLDRAITLYPDYVPARAFRGVLHAIRGRRDQAHHDAQEVRWRDNSPPTLYQLAGIYATTSKQVPEDRADAYQLLHAALRRGFGFDLIAEDRELDPIRDQPEFRRLVESAKLARGEKPPKP